MIPRYSRPQMAAIWEAENRYRIWFEIEAHALDAMAELGTVPKEAACKVWDWWATEPSIDVARIDAIEAEEARRHCLPDLGRRAGRAGGAFPPPGHDQLGRARHLPLG